MLAAADLDALAHARHADPFAVLGAHRVEGGARRVVAVLPGAERAQAVAAGDARVLATFEARGADGVFEAWIDRADAATPYRLRVAWPGQAPVTLADAYSVAPLLSDLDLHLLAEGTHARPWTVLGAHPSSADADGVPCDGVRFAVWAPNARRVSVVGDFNGWDARRHPMRHRGGGGVWELFVPHAAVGDAYKFDLLGPHGEPLPQKADPYARRSELRPRTASVVAPALDGDAARTLPAARAAANRRDAPIAIYEVHLGSWRRAPDGDFLDWDALAASLPAHAAALGFTHLELLPVSEHPFDGSWGYQTLGLYAPSARFGAPEGFARFVAACHAHGLGVLVDWVPAHFPTDAHGLARFDGTALYEYADPREGYHHDWNTLIYAFGRTEVASFLRGSALYWCERFGIDGLRVDAVASMLYRDYSRPSDQWVPNVHGGRENLEAIALLQSVNAQLGERAPGAITLAEESTSFPKVSQPTWAGGLGFHYKWAMGWMNDVLAYLQQDPVHRRWHHSRLTFAMMYWWSENFVLPISHDEVVHGKRSMLGKMPGDDWQRFANLRAFYGFMWGHPGKKLLFMGQEFAQPTEWNEAVELPWHLLDDAASPHAGVMRLVADLNRLMRASPALHRLDAEPSGFEWLAADDAAQSIVAWRRLDGAGDEVIVVVNFTPVPRHDWHLGLPDGAPAAWAEVLNTDATVYGGSGVGALGATLHAHDAPAHGRARSLVLQLPPLAALFLRPRADAAA